MTSASKTENGNCAGKVEYGYSLIQAGARTERIQYDASDNATSWKRYEVDGLLTYRVDERYDSDEDGLDSGDPWRVVEKRTYGPGLIGNLLFKEVLKYPDPTSDLNPDQRVYYYGYDAVGNVILITEEYCGGTAYKYCFHQDTFGNELQEGWFESDSWSEAEDHGIFEHQTGKEYDSFTGLYFYHFRWYDPVVGRFTSRSPLLPWEESAYVYCENDPVNLVDVDGVLPWYLELFEGISDFAYGFSDVLLFGQFDELIGLVERGTGMEIMDQCLLNKGSRSYEAGRWGGFLHSLLSGFAGGWRAAGTKAPELEFAHWIPDWFLKRFPRWIRNAFGKSRFNGNYISGRLHYKIDYYRYPPGYKKWGKKWPWPIQQSYRMPSLYKGGALGAGYGLGGYTFSGDNEICK